MINMVMNMKYDVVIVGAGPAGLFSAYELITKNKKLKIVLIRLFQMRLNKRF